MSVQFVKQDKEGEEDNVGDGGRMMRGSEQSLRSGRLCVTWRNLLWRIFYITLQELEVILWPMKRITGY